MEPLEFYQGRPTLTSVKNTQSTSHTVKQQTRTEAAKHPDLRTGSKTRAKKITHIQAAKQTHTGPKTPTHTGSRTKTHTAKRPSLTRWINPVSAASAGAVRNKGVLTWNAALKALVDSPMKLHLVPTPTLFITLVWSIVGKLEASFFINDAMANSVCETLFRSLLESLQKRQ